MNHFKQYEQDFIMGINMINKKIQNIATQTNQKKELAFSDIKADLTECEKQIKFMETQIAGLNPDAKFQFLRKVFLKISKVRQYRKDFDTIRKSLYRAQDNYAVEKNKEMLIGAQLDVDILQNQQNQNYNAKLITQGQMISDTTYKLKDGVRVMNQTMDISHNIGEELVDHTGRLRNNRKKLRGMDDDLGKSGKLAKSMLNRIRKNKFILFSILGIIFLVVIIILGIHFSKKQ